MPYMIAISPPLIDVEWVERSGRGRRVVITRGQEALLDLSAEDARHLGAALIAAAGGTVDQIQSTE